MLSSLATTYSMRMSTGVEVLVQVKITQLSKPSPMQCLACFNNILKSTDFTVSGVTTCGTVGADNAIETCNSTLQCIYQVFQRVELQAQDNFECTCTSESQALISILVHMYT